MIRPHDPFSALLTFSPPKRSNGGRPPAINDDKMAKLGDLLAAGVPPRDIAARLEISAAVLGRAIKQMSTA